MSRRLIAPIVGRSSRSAGIFSEERLAAFLDSKLYFVNSGTSALALAVLSAIRRKQLEHDRLAEIIIPAYCCPDIVTAIEFCGARPILVDFEIGSPRLSINGVQAAITEDTVAIVAVNFLGIPEQIGLLAGIADKHGVSLIHDSCQFFPVGPVDGVAEDYTVYSFGRGKPVSIFHGGLLAVRKELSRDLIGEISHHASGMIENSRYALRTLLQELGRNESVYGFAVDRGWAGGTHVRKLESIQTMLDYARTYLGANIDSYHRRENQVVADIYEALSKHSSEIVDITGSMSELDPRAVLRYSFLVTDGDQQIKVIEALRREGIGASSLYGSILPDITGCSIPRVRGSYTNSDDFSRRLVTVPAHGHVPASIIGGIERAFSRCGIG